MASPQEQQESPPSNPATVLLYQIEDGKTTLDVQLQEGTAWLTQAQMADLFQRDQSVISRHVNNVFKEGELPMTSNMHKMHIAPSDKPVSLNNLDFIISVGYRVKSQPGTPCPARRNIRSSPEEIDDPADRQSSGLRHEPAPRGGFAWMTP